MRSWGKLMSAIGVLFGVMAAVGVFAQEDAAPAGRPGWSEAPTDKNYTQLLTDLRASVDAEGMGVISEVGPTDAARKRMNVTIPGNRVVGVFRTDFAVRILNVSEAAMIEAPIRFYVTEQTDGTAKLSYKLPSFVFEPYADEGGTALQEAATELDSIFEMIATGAVTGTAQSPAAGPTQDAAAGPAATGLDPAPAT